MRRLLAFAAIIAAGFLVFALSRNATAQQDMFYFTRQIETAFADVETSRLASDCPTWRKRLDELQSYMRPLVGPNAKSFNAPIREEYRTRLAEAEARPCPPRVSKQSPTAAAAQLARTVTLEDLRFQLAEACGAKFDPARERLIAALDRAIRFETSPQQRRFLEADRTAVQRLKVPPCRTGGPATSATPPSPRQSFDALVEQLNDACGDSWSVLRLRTLAALDATIAAERNAQELRNLNAARTVLLRRDPPVCPSEPHEESLEDDGIFVWFVASTYFDRDLLASEQARLAGNCARRAAMLKSAKEAFTVMQAMGDAMPNPVTYAARLATQELRPCPDPQRKAAPTQVPVAPVRPGDPAGGIAALAGPPKPARNCVNIDRAREKGDLTCRCLGKAPLSIWGANPYRAESAICNAAIHAGVLPQSGMGMVRVSPVASGKAALGFARNGIEASNWDYGFENAFTVTPGGADPDDALPFDARYMSGTFDTGLGTMVLVNGRGSFGSNGSITPLRIAGPVLEAVWELPKAPLSSCADGKVRGRLRFVFTRTGFTGLFATCETNLNSTWDGTRRKSR